MSAPFKLYRLQQIDTQMDQAQARVSDIDSILSDDSVVQQAQAMEQRRGGELEEARRALRNTEEKVRSQRLKIEQSEAALYGGKVKNPKELQDLHHEAASLKRYLSVLEDRQLEAMIYLDEAEGQYNQAAASLKEISSRIAENNQKLVAERTNLLGELERLQNERQAACNSIPPDDQKLYEQLRKTRRGVAVSQVKDKSCSACGSTLNSALLQQARSPNQITRCDACGRILYSG